ncbi:MAG: class I SAM-dependent methyltransferase [Anaerolineae bacterium]|nr:class I SAM-dependent methyltransferase [Anaerolineae bacterium]
MTETRSRVAGSFRDPSGHMMVLDDRLLRQVNLIYQSNYDQLMSSGLYKNLTEDGLLVTHQEVEIGDVTDPQAYKLLKPELIPFISYPYEWSFSQLKDAALATLDIQKRALACGMSLKDASAYNIQFVGCKPILIDTLSFETYQEGKPWVAYRQFCQHFLAPLALMSLKDVRLGLMLRDFIDGVPLDLTAVLLPWRTRFNPGLMMHIHLHSATQRRYTDENGQQGEPERQTGVSKQGLLGIIDSLEATVRGLHWKPDRTAWADYYQGDSYTNTGTEHKQALVGKFLRQTKLQKVLDLGANTGLYSRIAAKQGCFTLSADFDPGAVELNYRQAVEKKETNLLPLVLDLTNPSPSIGWNNTERESFTGRCHVGCVLALALVHHLAIANNVPLVDIAAFLAGLTEWLIVEFIPKSDPKVQTLLSTREDIFPTYTPEGFEAAFKEYFTIVQIEPVRDSDRRLYLMQKREIETP